MKTIWFNDYAVKSTHYYDKLKDARTVVRMLGGSPYTVVRVLDWFGSFVGYAVVDGNAVTTDAKRG